MSLNVTIPDTFTGPLDLLLHLIRRDEMDIHDIPVARLAASYQEEIRRLDVINFDEGIEFLDLASTLLEIKSRMLLPPEERPEGEEDALDAFDPRSGLVEALLEYRRFKDAARTLEELALEQARRFPRVAPRPEFHILDGPEEAPDYRELYQAFHGMMFRLVRLEESSVISYTEIPTSVRIEQIEAVLRDVGRTRFSLLLSGRPDRGEMVDFFIAILELIRQRKLVARQADNFTDIILERREPPARPETGRKAPFRVRVARTFPAPALARPVPAPAAPELPETFPPRVPGRARGVRGPFARPAPRFFC